mgnify:CR=1 FL=1
MSRFIFSADGHIIEPQEIYTDALPASLHNHGLRSQREGDYIVTYCGQRVIFRLPLKPPTEEIGNFGRPKQKGVRNLDARLEDMEMEGIDAEIIFPTMGMQTFGIVHPEAEMLSTQGYNNWLHGFLQGRDHTFIGSAVLPVHDFTLTIEEMKRVAAMGYTNAMLPSFMPEGLPHYNDERWNPVFETAQNLNLVLVVHTATGRPEVRVEKGLGGAVINYTDQMRDSIQTLTYMVAGGILDRFPGVKVAFIECGASWLAGVAERMDETYHGHQMFVNPKLSVPPSEIVKRQIHASFQYDRACIMSRSVTGANALMWGSDYPHHEGTFPESRQVLAKLFDGIDISEHEKDNILGGNAATLFRLNRPEFVKAA